jgi:hypothetical protein
VSQVVQPTRPKITLKQLAEKDLVTRPPKTRARYKSETLRALRRYERKHKMTSAEFYRRFQAGELLEDERDYFDWRVRYNSYLRMSRPADD